MHKNKEEIVGGLSGREGEIREPLLAVEQQQQHQSDEDIPTSSSLLVYLYFGHFLARWGARMWEFSVGLYMIDIWPNSLLLAAVYGVVESASTALLGSLVGQLVNGLSYVKIVQVWLLAQNVSFIIAGGSMFALLSNPDLKLTNFTAFISLVVIVNISGAVGVLSTLAGTILIEREWVVVISEGHSEEILTKMNSVIRRIDLSCKLFAPVATGFIITFVSPRASALAFSLWNIISVCSQYWLLMSVYNGIPSLRERNEKRMSRRSHTIDDQSPSTSRNEGDLDSDSDSENENDLENYSGISEIGWKRRLRDRVNKIPYFRAWRVYLKQDVVLPGLALALLYFTVLSFGTLMTAALEWEGIPAYAIGIARGISATIGIAATFLYPILQSRLSTLRTGLWSIWSQWTCLLVCVASIWVKNNLQSSYMLMGGVALSRLGLWMFDLSAIQQMQDQVSETDRIVVGGVQNSLQSVLDLMTYVMGIIISNPQDFWQLVILSFLLVTIAAALYSLHIYRVRKHLIHFEKWLLLVPFFVHRSYTQFDQ